MKCTLPLKLKKKQIATWNTWVGRWVSVRFVSFWKCTLRMVGWLNIRRFNYSPVTMWYTPVNCKLFVPKSCKSYMLEPLYTPQKKPTWQWKITICNRKYIFNRLVFHRHVSFPGREWHWLSTSQNFSTFFFYTNLSLSRHLHTFAHFFKDFHGNIASKKVLHPSIWGYWALGPHFNYIRYDIFCKHWIHNSYPAFDDAFIFQSVGLFQTLLK